jgi:SAM-dependent methyltransferase
MSATPKAAQPSFLFSEQHKLFANFLAHTTQETECLNYLRRAIGALGDTLSPPIRYLDVGCGYGTKTAVIVEALGRIELVAEAFDPSKDLLSCFAEEAGKLNISLTEATLETYPLQSSYDLITSIHVFYYVHDWSAAIASLLDVLTARGRICICLRSNDDVCAFKDEFLGEIQGSPAKERTSNQLEALLDEPYSVYD